MSEQFDFTFGTPERPATKLEAAFWVFHDANPGVYELFDRFTRDVMARRHKNFSADAILHRIRWETAIQTTGPIFKIANAHSAYYSRLWMRDNPEFSGFFRTCRTQGVSAALAGDNDNTRREAERAA